MAKQQVTIMGRVCFVAVLFAAVLLASVASRPVQAQSTVNFTYNVTYNYTAHNSSSSVLVSAAANGMALDTGNPVIIVSPGARLTGSMTVQESDSCSFCILPVTSVNSWDRAFYSAVGYLAGDNNLHPFTFSFSFTAPISPGTYYIATFHRACYAPQDNVYGCYGLGDPRRGVPGGGDDIWDISNFADWLPGGSFSSGRAIKVVVSAPALPDLSITNVLGPVQVVFNPDINNDTRIDLVKGKNTTIFLTAILDDPSNLVPSNQPIAFNLSIGNAVFTETFPAGNFKGPVVAPIQFFFEPNETGDFTIKVVADAFNSIAESNKNNNVKEVNISVKDTGNFLAVYKKVDYTIDFVHLGPVDKYDETVGNSSLFLNATFPLNPQKFNTDNSDSTFSAGFPIPLLNPFLLGKFFNPTIDMADLCTQGRLQTSNRANVTIGIVSDNYFSFYDNENTSGLSSPITCGVLARQTYWTAVAHEIGHLYGLPVNPAINSPNGMEEYNLTDSVVSYPGNPATGFWVDRNILINNRVCFMGASKNETLDFHWIDNEDYMQLFRNFVSNKNDPEVLFMTGFIFKNGTIILGNWYSFPNGTIDTLPVGNYSIQTLNNLGNVITQTSLDVPFVLNFDPTGAVAMNGTAFAFSIPFPQNTTSVKITLYNTTLIVVEPNSKTLRDAINSIPDFGFINNPNQRRNALINKIDAVDNMLQVNNTFGAVQKLKFDIKDKIEKWIVEYVPKTPSQLSKSYILDSVENTIKRLSLL